MKKLLLLGSVLAVLGTVVAVSQSRTTTQSPATGNTSGFGIESGEKNPWTGLRPNAGPGQFQFAVVSDRTGGHREKVFSKAVHQVNLLQPEFIMSVGDLIEGYSTKEDVVAAEWDQFDAYVQKFQAPFFYVPGNHDLTNPMQVKKWGERYGKRYYHFTYEKCLFLCLCSENPPNEMGAIDAEQREYVKKTLEANKDMRWTFVFLHKPIWAAKDLQKNGWAPVEEALAGRKYTVFCGHVHRYQKFVRNGNNYYQLATTGGGSRLRGVEYGEFDHVAWVTMKSDAPLIANVMLDGILPEDLKLPDTAEPGTKRKTVPTFPAAGKVTLDGRPLVGATVTLHKLNKDTEKYVNTSDGLTDKTGAFRLSTYGAFDGAPVGEFVVTVVKTGRGYHDGETPEKSVIPARYASPATSGLRVELKEGPNEFNLDLRGQ
ncbi:MAG TPA: metallophosphoesterase [Urbifossiella sp.]|nr:metallophosphoesterase [Urbifossiella sp.]